MTLLTERSLLLRCREPVLSDEKYHDVGCLFLSRIVSGMRTGGHLWYMHRVCNRLFLVHRHSYSCDTRPVPPSTGSWDVVAGCVIPSPTPRASGLLGRHPAVCNRPGRHGSGHDAPASNNLPWRPRGLPALAPTHRPADSPAPLPPRSLTTPCAPFETALSLAFHFLLFQLATALTPKTDR